MFEALELFEKTVNMWNEELTRLLGRGATVITVGMDANVQPSESWEPYVGPKAPQKQPMSTHKTTKTIDNRFDQTEK